MGVDVVVCGKSFGNGVVENIAVELQSVILFELRCDVCHADSHAHADIVGVFLAFDGF